MLLISLVKSVEFLLDVICSLVTSFASCCQYSSACPLFLLKVRQDAEFVFVFQEGLSEKHNNLVVRGRWTNV